MRNPSRGSRHSPARSVSSEWRSHVAAVTLLPHRPRRWARSRPGPYSSCRANNATPGNGPIPRGPATSRQKKLLMHASEFACSSPTPLPALRTIGELASRAVIRAAQTPSRADQHLRSHADDWRPGFECMAEKSSAAIGLAAVPKFPHWYTFE